MQSRWQDEEAKQHVGDLAQRVYTSRLLGADPSLVLHGEHDLIPLETAGATAELIGARFRPVPDSGHVPYVEAFEEFRDAMDAFLP